MQTIWSAHVFFFATPITHVLLMTWRADADCSRTSVQLLCLWRVFGVMLGSYVFHNICESAQQMLAGQQLETSVFPHLGKDLKAYGRMKTSSQSDKYRGCFSDAQHLTTLEDSFTAVCTFTRLSCDSCWKYGPRWKSGTILSFHYMSSLVWLTNTLKGGRRCCWCLFWYTANGMENNTVLWSAPSIIDDCNGLMNNLCFRSDLFIREQYLDHLGCKLYVYW